MSRRRRVTVALAALALVSTIAACSASSDTAADATISSGPDASPMRMAAAESASAPASPDPAPLVGGSYTWHFGVENNLDPIGASHEAPQIVWSVSDTSNEYWDGSSRPDHAPPQGLQGFTQAARSGGRMFRTELNSWGGAQGAHFTLTPSVLLDGQTYPLQPLRVEASDFWNRWIVKAPTVGNICFGAPYTGSVTTPAGTFTYKAKATCEVTGDAMLTLWSA